jgi:hypothetical protein
VGITLGTTGTDVNVSGSPITTSGNITINIPDASATARGVVSTGTQTFAGAKTFNSDIIVNGVNVGRGGGNISGNVILGSVLANNTTGIYNVAINGGALTANTTGRDNVAIGYVSLNSNTTGERNTAVGGESMYDNLTGSENTAIGLQALSNMTTGKWNVSIGNRSATLAGSGGAGLFASNNSIYIGYDSRAGSDNQTNQIVIGHNAIGQGSNTVTIGNSSTTLNKLFGRVIHSDAINADESATLGQVNTSLAGYVTLGTAQTITAQKTFTTSGSSDTMIISHGSGSGFALDVIKAGNGEVVRVNKTSGSGNAMTVIGGNFEAPTIVKTGGTSSQFLKADGSVDSSTYLTTSTAASTYVPYTGATGAVNLGTHSLSANNLTANGGTNAGRLELKNADNASLIRAGYFVLSPSSNNTIIQFGFGTGASTWKNFGFSSHLIPDNTITLFSLPSGGGTLAVTSDLGAYLPLAGGTLTGGLGGTSASFSSDVQTSTRFIAATTGGDITLTPNLSGTTNRIASTGSLPFSLTSIGAITLAAGGTTPQITLATGGAVTLTGALNGTSASFTGLLTISANSSANAIAINGRASDSTGSIDFFQNNGTTRLMEIGVSPSAAEFYYDANSPMIFYTNASPRLTLASTGAATFSSSVTSSLGSSGANFNSNAATTGSVNAYRVSHSNGIGSFGLEANAGGDLMIGGLANATLLQSVSNTPLQLGTNQTARLTILQGGNVGIGTAIPATKLDVVGLIGTRSASLDDISNPTEGIRFGWSDGGGDATYRNSIFNNVSTFSNSGLMQFRVNSGISSQRIVMSLLGSGNVGIGTPSPSKRLDVRASVAGEVASFANERNSAGDYGFVSSLGSNCNNTSAYHYIAVTGGADRVYIFGNGNIQNQNNSYGALSDAKLKENITDASPKLYDLLKVKVRNYNLIGEETKQIGVIAQELEEVFPAMIDESEDFEEVEVPQLDEEGNEVLNEEDEVVTTKERVSKGTTTKSVKYSVFIPMLIKAIQELKAEIDSLKTK